MSVMSAPKRKVNRKPVHKLNGYDSREAIWKAIRRLKTFTVRELHMETTLRLDSVRDYCIGLAKAGYIAKTGDQKTAGNKGVAQKAVIWKLVRDVGVKTPRVRKDGSKVIQGLGREQMWLAMRILKIFSVRQLAVSASTEECAVKESSAADYCHYLCRAGYITRRQDNYYLFLKSRYSGPKPPMIQRTKQVFDPNLQKVVWSSQPRGGSDHGE